MNDTRKNAPKDADEYFIDYDGSLHYLKENREFIHTRCLGWEAFDKDYQDSVIIHPLHRVLNGREFVEHYGVDVAKSIRGTTSNAMIDMGHYRIHVDDIDAAIQETGTCQK